LPNGDYELSAKGEIDGVEKQSADTVSAGLSNGEITGYPDHLYLEKIPIITYHNNGGTGSLPDPQEVKKNGNVIIAEGVSLTKDTEVFKIWYTKKYETGKIFRPSSYYIPDGTERIITLYAIYSKDCIVSYNLNGGTGTVPASYTEPINSSIKIAGGSELSKTGYTFENWNTKADGSGTSYEQDQEVQLSTSLYLYTTWTGKTYKVTFDRNDEENKVIFDKNGGGEIDPEETDVIYGSPYGTLPRMQIPGYEYRWYTEKTGGKEITKDSIVKTAGDHTLYAHLTPNTYTIKYNKDCDVSAPESVSPVPKNDTKTYGKDFTVGSMTRTGYTFKGWNTEKNGSGKEVKSVLREDLTIIADDLTVLYAQWEPNNYTVTFNGNGDTRWPPSDPSTPSITVTYDDPYGTLATVSRTSHEFTGWYTAASGGTKITETTVVKITKDTTLYAQWTRLSGDGIVIITFGGAP